ncbi:polyhydroxyalkanoic acid system family protein [Allosphingosinicella sp.]|jgi:hypothetical protein|uniref:polyhydroxyalkanoic acid system family protein n=1 Tax=Allosphingosinicella sp. TaxID=2823234 RepID=UPI002F1680F3
MIRPLVVDLPHRLGADEARRRIAGGIGKLRDHIPGAAKVDSKWEGDRLDLGVEAMAQRIAAKIEVGESAVRVEVHLPAALAFFAKPIEAVLRRGGAELLEGGKGPA